ncbi:hypothetical protein SEPCBS57363_000789 [Sporothrix epigloea]|uniref:Borealin N-terminal domain-containing protein n=1 Tax=Sporothrix epigloea TaxID=1892477 RepID=A0ABP0D6P4_9PEZI
MPPRGKKRKSDDNVASDIVDAKSTTTTMEMPATAGSSQTVATKTEDSSRKRQKVAVTLTQKQALIDNLQLEGKFTEDVEDDNNHVTERARQLRAQYNLQAQGLRTRIEIRVNRIPMALRKLKMGDLLLKYSTDQQKAALKPVLLSEMDQKSSRTAVSRTESPRAAHVAVKRSAKRLSDHLTGGDKENQNSHLDNPKKRQLGGAKLTGNSNTQHGQVLSPASSNSRLNPRDRERTTPVPTSPIKSLIARPMSPTKASTTNLISSTAGKARSTRATTSRKPTTSSTASSATGGPTATTARTRGRGAAAAAAAPASRSTAAAAARNARRTSGTSESSDASTSTVVRKASRPATGTTASGVRKVTGTTAASSKKSVTSTAKNSVTGAATKRAAVVKTAASTATASATTRSGRVLRKRD